MNVAELMDRLTEICKQDQVSLRHDSLTEM
jgi:hypothetical protein